MRNNKNKKIGFKIPVLSFFTGGGFLDMGFEQSGFSIVWSNEANPVFADLYSYGMTRLRQSESLTAEEIKIVDVRNIEKIYASEIVEAAFPDKKARFFGVIGGPPCPDFSVGGKNKGGKGLNGRLSKTYVHRICKIKPSFFVFENVSGLYNTKIHREFLMKLEHKLENAGYCLDLRILNALELGLPQDRERLIMIGIKKSIVNKCLGRKIDVKKRGWFRWPKRKYSNAKEKFAWPKIVKVGMSPKKPRNVPKELTVDYCINNGSLPVSMANALDTFKAKSRKFHIIKEGDTKRKSFKRLHRYRYSPTVCYGHNEVHLHPWEPRRLSVREAMRIQGIPDAYELPPEATLTSKFAMISNGVPVPLAFEVAKSLKRFFNKGNFLKRLEKMAIHNTSYDAANTAVRAFLTKVGGKYWGRSFNTASGSGEITWKEIRDEVFGGACCYCGNSLVKLQIEHLVMFNREEYGLHHPGNVAPVCKECNKRGKNKSGKHLFWEEHLHNICLNNKDLHNFENRRKKIIDHIEKGKFFYPRLSPNEKHSIRVIAESLYHNIITETENSLILYEKIAEAFVNKPGTKME